MSFAVTCTTQQFVSPVVWSRSHRQGEPRRRTEPTGSNDDVLRAGPGPSFVFMILCFFPKQDCDTSSSPQRVPAPERLRILADSSVRTCAQAACAAIDSGSRSKFISARTCSDSKTAVGGAGVSGAMQIGLFREGASARSAEGWAPRPIPVQYHGQGTRTPISKLDLPFETAPETTRESPRTRTRRARTPSRVIRLRRLIRLFSSRRLMCLSLEKTSCPTSLHSNRRQLIWHPPWHPPRSTMCGPS